MHPEDPNVGARGAPVQPPSSPATTSRPAADPTAIAAFRAAQSANDRLTHIQNQLAQRDQQLGSVTTVLQNLVTSQNASNDESFFDRLGQQLSNGEIDQAAYTRRVAERTAQRVAAQTIMPQAQQRQTAPAPAPPATVDPNAEARRAQQYGARAIVQGLGLQGNEPGLDFSSPQALMQSGQRVLAQRQTQGAQQAPPEFNVNEAMGELARQQGYVIPHRDGGRPAGAHPQATEADLAAIVWDRRNKNAPARMKAALQNVRDSLAARTPSMRTGEGLLGNPNTFRGG
jgi:hypothetical protein